MKKLERIKVLDGQEATFSGVDKYIVATQPSPKLESSFSQIPERISLEETRHEIIVSKQDIKLKWSTNAKNWVLLGISITGKPEILYAGTPIYTAIPIKSYLGILSIVSTGKAFHRKWISLITNEIPGEFIKPVRISTNSVLRETFYGYLAEDPLGNAITVIQRKVSEGEAEMALAFGYTKHPEAIQDLIYSKLSTDWVETTISIGGAQLIKGELYKFPVLYNRTVKDEPRKDEEIILALSWTVDGTIVPIITYINGPLEDYTLYIEGREVPPAGISAREINGLDTYWVTKSNFWLCSPVKLGYELRYGLNKEHLREKGTLLLQGESPPVSLYKVIIQGSTIKVSCPELKTVIGPVNIPIVVINLRNYRTLQGVVIREESPVRLPELLWQESITGAIRGDLLELTIGGRGDFKKKKLQIPYKNGVNLTTIPDSGGPQNV